ncbi:MAG: hypothetical protein IT373_01415 [Polyangiaceae bacterium]|nr:hypothetical protein [Polyangiaceae bacterium]
MATSVRSVDYFYTTVVDQPGEAASLLSMLKESGVQLLAFSIVPTGATHTQLMIFPEATEHLVTTARRAGLVLEGPQYAFLVQGDNELGALCDYHQRLADAHINVFAASGVTDGRGGFGYILYVKPEDFYRAAQVLGIRASRVPPPPSRPETPPPPSSRR